MSMTAGEILAVTRVMLKDDILPYRWTNAELYGDLSDGLYQLKAKRADLLLQADGTLATVADITADGDAVNYPDRFRDAIASYVAYRRYLTEDSDVNNTRQADLHLSRWNEAIATL